MPRTPEPSTMQESPTCAGFGSSGEHFVAFHADPPSFAHGMHFSASLHSPPQMSHSMFTPPVSLGSMKDTSSLPLSESPGVPVSPDDSPTVPVASSSSLSSPSSSPVLSPLSSSSAPSSLAVRSLPVFSVQATSVAAT